MDKTLGSIPTSSELLDFICSHLSSTHNVLGFTPVHLLNLHSPGDWHCCYFPDQIASKWWSWTSGWGNSILSLCPQPHATVTLKFPRIGWRLKYCCTCTGERPSTPSVTATVHAGHLSCSWVRRWSSEVAVSIAFSSPWNGFPCSLLFSLDQACWEGGGQGAFTGLLMSPLLSSTFLRTPPHTLLFVLGAWVMGVPDLSFELCGGMLFSRLKLGRV